MFPRFTRNNSLNVRSGYVVAVADGFTFNMVGERIGHFTKLLSDGLNLKLCQLGHAVPCATNLNIAAFGKFIVRVGLCVTEKQVVWPNTSTVIAFMANKFKGPQLRLIMQFIRESVGGTLFTVVKELPIPSRAKGAIPKPATLRDFYVRPKASCRISALRTPSTRTRAVLLGQVCVETMIGPFQDFVLAASAYANRYHVNYYTNLLGKLEGSVCR